MTRDEFLDLVRELRDMGATEVGAGDFSVKFPSPKEPTVVYAAEVAAPTEDVVKLDGLAAYVHERFGVSVEDLMGG